MDRVGGQQQRRQQRVENLHPAAAVIHLHGDVGGGGGGGDRHSCRVVVRSIGHLEDTAALGISTRASTRTSGAALRRFK